MVVDNWEEERSPAVFDMSSYFNFRGSHLALPFQTKSIKPDFTYLLTSWDCCRLLVGMILVNIKI